MFKYSIKQGPLSGPELRIMYDINSLEICKFKMKNKAQNYKRVQTFYNVLSLNAQKVFNLSVLKYFK